jgi:hypothetical protein
LHGTISTRLNIETDLIAIDLILTIVHMSRVGVPGRLRGEHTMLAGVLNTENGYDVSTKITAFLIFQIPRIMRTAAMSSGHMTDWAHCHPLQTELRRTGEIPGVEDLASRVETMLNQVRTLVSQHKGQTVH